MTAPTRENPNPPPLAPREPKGALVGDGSETAAPQIRGYAPPIIDTAPAPSLPSSPPQLPRLWLSFWSDGVKLFCAAKLKSSSGSQSVEFDPTNPVLAQAYAYFVKLMTSPAEPANAPPAEPANAPPAEPANAPPAEPANAPPAEPANAPAKLAKDAPTEPAKDAEPDTRKDPIPPPEKTRPEIALPSPAAAAANVSPPPKPNPEQSSKRK